MVFMLEAGYDGWYWLRKGAMQAASANSTMKYQHHSEQPARGGCGMA
jgi:hypothetical protein